MSIYCLGVFYFLSIYFVKILHFTPTIAGTIISFYGIGAVIGSFASGYLSDQLNPIKISIVSLFMQGMCYLLLIKLNNSSLLCLNSMFLGFSSYSFIVANNFWVLNQCEENNKLKVINFLSTASNLGLSIAAVIVSLTTYFGFLKLFFILGFFLFLLASYMIFFIHKKYIFSYVKNNSIAKIKVESKKERKIIMQLTLFFLFLMGLIVSQRSITYPLFVQDTFNVNGLQIMSLLFILYSLLVVFFEVPLGNFFNNYNKILMLGVGAFLIGMGMWILSFSSLLFMIILACIIYTIGEILFFCMSQYLFFQMSASHKKGTSLGAYRMIYALSRIVGPAAGGYLFHNFGSYMIWWLSGMLGFSCLLISNYYKKYFKQILPAN